MRCRPSEWGNVNMNLAQGDGCKCDGRDDLSEAERGNVVGGEI